MRRFLSLLFVLTILVLPGCTRGRLNATPTPGSSISSTAGIVLVTPALSLPAVTLTATVDLTVAEPLAFTPSPTTIDPTYFKFPTITPTPTLDPSLTLLRIVEPGPMSKVVSPIEFIVHIAPEYTGTTRVELIGEDGVELYRKVFKTYSNIVYYTRIDEKIQYEIKGVAEMARLQVSTLDGSGRVQALNSVRLLLQAVGANEISPSYSPQDRLLLRYPNNEDEISAGTLPVTGEFQPATDLPLVFELIDVDGNVLGSRLLQLGPADGTYQQFTTIIPYQVTRKTPVRLVIHQADDRIEGLAYLFSVSLLIGP